MPKSGNYGKFWPKHAVLGTLGIMILAPVAISSNNTFAQTLHDQMLYGVVKQTSGQVENSHIDVGDSPYKIELLDSLNSNNPSMIYVANVDSNSISVISTADNTKIKDIPVGSKPIDIAFSRDFLYVPTTSGNVSVISTVDNTKIKDIPVGWYPQSIAVGNDILYVTNEGNLTNEVDGYVSVISTADNTKIKDIPVGGSPANIVYDNYFVYLSTKRFGYEPIITVISVDNNTKIAEIPVEGGADNLIAVGNDVLYVTNENITSWPASYLSVISTENNTNIKNITVGSEPMDIAFSSGFLYVSNSGSSSISVISTENNTKIKEIPVGYRPTAIRLPSYTTGAEKPNIYVANSGSSSISVISTENNTNIKNITVGSEPTDIAVDSDTDTVYVANSGSDSISVIDGTDNKVVVGITFQVNPFNSGVILCDDLSTTSPDDITPPSPIGQNTYVYPGTKCTAKPNPGFEFVSWEENNLSNNSTQLINVSRPSYLDSFFEFFNPNSDRPEATLKITKFGTFTANFREAPPPLPPEFWVQMYAVIGTVVTALFIPSIIGWFKSKRDAKKLNHFHRQIATLYQDGKLNENGIAALDGLRDDVIDTYSEGKMNEKHYESLKNEMSIFYEKIFRNRIKGLLKNNPSNKKAIEEQLTQIKTELEYTYSEGKISEIQYVNLKDEISILYDKIFRKRIDDSLNDGLQKETTVKHLKEIRDELEYAYSEGKISQKHYDLLNKAISKLDGKEGVNAS